jgi:putative peptide zinc metalloprotease protein
MSALAPAVVDPVKAAATAQEGVILPPLRADLSISKQTFEGRTYYVVKDPISLQYFRLTAEDYHLAILFNGVRTFGQIRDTWVESHRHLRLEYTPDEINERVLKFANDLALLQFLSVQGQRVKARMDASRKQKASKGGLYNFTNQVFFFRKSLFDPDRIFGKMAKPLWWVWTKPTFWISWAIIAFAALVFFAKAEGLDQALANLFNWHNLALMWVTTILLKSVHELGHGLTCKHFGGEVHEIGFMSMVFTPYFFVNVSDSWTMPNRKHRMLVSFAGIYVELIFAAFAVFLWASVQPGWFKDFLFNVIVICSVSTLLFNANPLMRFDGYYIMIDLIETPNLQQKSRLLIQQKVTRWLFGSANAAKTDLLARMPLPKKRLPLFYLYAVLSWLYGYYVIYKLIVWMRPHLEPIGLEGLTDWFAVLAFAGWVVVPLWHFVKHLHLSREDLKPKGRWRRIGVLFGIPLAAFIGFCFVPVEKEITRHGAVELAEPEIVHPETGGFIREILVNEGDLVQPGTVLARLENRELNERATVASLDLRRYELVLAAAIGLGKPEEVRQLEAMRDGAKTVAEKANHDVAQLELRAKTAGVVLSRDLQQRVGAFLRPPQDALCEIGSLDPMRIKIPLSEKEVRYVQPNNPVTLLCEAYPGEKFQGRVLDEPQKLEPTNFPIAFSKDRGGDVPTFRDPATGHEKLLENTYAVTVEIANPGGRLRYGMTMRARIDTGKRLYGKLVLQWFTDLISLDYRF